MGVRFTCYGCRPASVGVLTPTIEYNSPPMMVSVECEDSASLVTVACWTIHNLTGSIYLLFTRHQQLQLPRTTQHATRSTRNSAFTDAQTRLAHSAHRWQQNRQKFRMDRLQIDARPAWPLVIMAQFGLSSACLSAPITAQYVALTRAIIQSE